MFKFLFPQFSQIAHPGLPPPSPGRPIASQRLILGFSLLFVACGEPEENGKPSTTEVQSTEAEVRSLSVSSRLASCGAVPPVGYACTGIEEYNACIQRDCDAELKQCFGSNYPRGDYSGGACESLTSCAVKADDPCEHNCSPSANCNSCLQDSLAECLLASECPQPFCSLGLGGCAGLAACCRSIEPGSIHRVTCDAWVEGAEKQRTSANSGTVETVCENFLVAAQQTEVCAP